MTSQNLPVQKRHKFLSKILQINDLTPTVKEYIISTPDDFDFIAGQFVTIKFPLSFPKARIVSRAYSVASAPSLKGKIELCIKLVETGKVTPLLFNSPPAEINVMGPMGKFYLSPQNIKQDIIFIATGTGIAPFKSMIEELLLAQNHPGKLMLIAGVRYEAEELYPSLWNNLIKRFPNFKYANAISRPKDSNFSGNKGRVTSILPKYINTNRDQLFIICGLKGMINSIKAILENHNIDSQNIIFEKYD